MKRFKVCDKEGKVLGEFDSKQRAIEFAFGYQADPYYLPESEANNYPVGSVVPHKILKWCDLPTLEAEGII